MQTTHRAAVSIRTTAMLTLLLAACAATHSTDGVDPVAADPSAVSDWVDDEGPISLTNIPDWERYRDNARVRVGESTLYRVEWDLWFGTEEALREHYDELAEGVVKKAHVWTQLTSGRDLTRDPAGVLHIRYCVSRSFSNHAAAVSDMANAVARWEAVANVNFDYVSSQDSNCVAGNSAIDLAVISAAIDGPCATPSFRNWVGVVPVDALGCPNASGVMQIGTLVMDYAAVTGPLRSEHPALTPAGAFRHELGHVLGLRHEHPWAPSPVCSEPRANFAGDSNGRQLTGVAYDRDSVMHYPVCGGDVTHDYNITPTDGASMRALYGMPVAWYVAARTI